MKKQVLLKVVLCLTILVELVIIVMVYQKIGNERLPTQIGRLVFQLILMVFILSQKANIAIFILAGFHVITAILHFYSQLNWLAILLGSFHLICGMLIYFNIEVEATFVSRIDALPNNFNKDRKT